MMWSVYVTEAFVLFLSSAQLVLRSSVLKVLDLDVNVTLEIFGPVWPIL
jgi:hypothetical protein